MTVVCVCVCVGGRGGGSETLLFSCVNCGLLAMSISASTISTKWQLHICNHTLQYISMNRLLCNEYIIVCK